MMIHLIREGMPVGKARARTVRNASGKTWSYTPAKTAEAEEEWRWLYLNVCQPAYVLTEEPLSMTVIAYMPDPLKKLDLDNICKCVLDALEGMAYKNDSQIVHIEAWKTTGKPRTEMWLTDKIQEVKHD